MNSPKPVHRILFVCHGNICRSTMAQFVMEDLVRRAGREDEFIIDSAATKKYTGASGGLVRKRLY